MKFLIVIFVILEAVIAKKRGESCVTPNDESAKCIPVRSCIPIVKALETGNSNFIEFAKKSQCGYDTEALVCCGRVGHFIPREPPSNNFGNIFANLTTCGLERQTDRVKGGEITELDEFPWMAALEYVSKSNGKSQGIKCGATIINQRYLLTAAHCIATDDLLLSRAWLGEWRLSTDPDCQTIVAYTDCADPAVKLKITIQLAHPNFNKVNGRHDIGLLGVEKDIHYTDFIRPICMPIGNIPVPEIKSILTVAGWGITDDGKESDIKLKVEVPLLSNEACNAKLHVPLTPNQYCAGGETGKDSCRGDSGGPLMRAYQPKVTLQPQWYLEGVVSYGLGCGREGYPAIYTRVTKYMSWIAKTIAQGGN